MSDFSEDPSPPTASDGPAAPAWLVRLDGFEGPLDLLLDLAREQKVDLAHISILQLADQYLAFVTEARLLRLELAADYLVMAAWLAYLKSRLLVPAPEPDADAEPTGEALAALLALQLRRLEAMRQAGQSLMALPQLGRDLFARGAPEGLHGSVRPVYQVSLFDLLKAYSDFHRRQQAGASYQPLELDLHSAEEALERLRAWLTAGLGGASWVPLEALLPPRDGGGLRQRSAMAATFLATLELVREGAVELRQGQMFGPVQVRRSQAGPPHG